MNNPIPFGFPEDETTQTYTGLIMKLSYSQAILNVIKIIKRDIARGDALDDSLLALSVVAQMDVDFAMNRLKELAEMKAKDDHQ